MVQNRTADPPVKKGDGSGSALLILAAAIKLESFVRVVYRIHEVIFCWEARNQDFTMEEEGAWTQS